MSILLFSMCGSFTSLVKFIFKNFNLFASLKGIGSMLSLLDSWEHRKAINFKC